MGAKLLHGVSSQWTVVLCSYRSGFRQEI